MNIRLLINDDGCPFDSSEIQILRATLDSLTDDKRKEYRDQNALAVAKHGAVKILVVSGPGTGKSRLFIKKIDHWNQKDRNANVVVTSFVRKLVADLQNDIERDEKLSAKQKGNITVSTLHKFARSLVERNHGTTEWPFKPHFRIIGQSWKEIVWNDVLAYYPEIDRGKYTWKKFEEQLHNNKYERSNGWNGLKDTYFKLCRFYNSAGFADLILRATTALSERSDLNNDRYFIIDEYQDFNLAEESLIKQLVGDPKGLLVAGDDEQVLYEKLKSSKPALIRNMYQKTDYAKGMLPFCSRSSYHITKTADYFIQQRREAESIEKIFLPLKNNNSGPKVQVIACAAPSTAVDYIEKYVADYEMEIDERKRQLEAGEAKDAFLMILTPAKEMKFYGKWRDKIKRIVAKYQAETRLVSDDYYQLLNYYSLANNPNDNFTFRKVFQYEGVSEDKIHALLAQAIRDEKNLCDYDIPEIKDISNKCSEIKNILEADSPVAAKLEKISCLISINDRKILQKDIERNAINQEGIARLEHEEEEATELEEIEVKRMGAVELMTVVGYKGLSAENVIIIGFDNVNMNYVTKNAFYVAITRARRSLHILTALKSGGAIQTHNFLDQLPDIHMEYYSYKKSNHSKNKLQGKREFKDCLDYLNSMSCRGRK